MTPHSEYYAQVRSDTVSEPFKLIPGTSVSLSPKPAALTKRRIAPTWQYR